MVHYQKKRANNGMKRIVSLGATPAYAERYAYTKRDEDTVGSGIL